MSFVRAAPILGLLTALGCAAPEPRNPVPDPDLSGMEPQVVELLQRTRERLIADTDSAEAWGELGAVYDAHVLNDLAETCYRRAAELAPDDFRWIYLHAILREIGGADTEEVGARFARAAELKPAYPPLYVRLGDALWRRGSYDEAQEALSRAIDLAPQIAVAQRRLGQVLLAQGQAEAAAMHLARAVTLEPGDLAAYTGLAQALNRAGQADRARQVLERARGLEPVNALPDPIYEQEVARRSINSGRAFARATSSIAEGAFAAALDDLEIVLRARPEDASAHYWMGTARQRLDQQELAIEHLARAVELEPTLARAWLQLGRIHAARGSRDEALAHLREALRLAPDDAEARAALEGLERSGS